MLLNSVRSSQQEYDAFVHMIKIDFPYTLPNSIFDDSVFELFKLVYNDIIAQHSRITNGYYSESGNGLFTLAYLDHYLILCYRFAHALFVNKMNVQLADAVYYTSKIRTSTDIYYRVVIGDFFLPVHPLGSVVDSRATYGKGFRLYNGVQIGPYGIAGKNPVDWVHPVIGDGVIVYANSCIYGRTVVGNNVTITPCTTIINEKIPDSCIVFGISPNLKLIPNNHNNLDMITT